MKNHLSLDDLLLLANEEFINEIYRILLNRQPDVGGRAHYLHLLRTGTSKTEVIAQIRKSPEGIMHSVHIEGIDGIVGTHSKKANSLFRSVKKIFDGKSRPQRSLAQTATNVERIEKNHISPTREIRTTRSVQSNIVCVIPFYNGASFIDRALESVFSQTVRADEVIVVNDGSRSEERDYVHSLKKKYPIIVIDKQNGGQGSARNAGVAASQSEYICMLDQDDFYLPRHNEILLNNVPRDDPTFGWIYGDLVEAEGDGSFMRTSMVKEHSSHPKRSFIDLIGNDMFVLPSASLISRKAFDSIGGFDEQFTGYEDDDLFLRLFRKGWSNVFVDTSVTVWCIHSESTSYSVRMSRSRFKYFAKLAVQYPDDPEKVRYYFRDLLVPRFGPLIIADALKANECRSKDKEEIYEILEKYAAMVRANKGISRKAKKKLDKIVYYLTKWPNYGAQMARRLMR